MLNQIITLPKGATNCHAHVIGPDDLFPLDDNRPFAHPEAPAETLFAMQDFYGLDRLVLIQSLAHGNDHSAAAAAIAMRPENTCGVAFAKKNASVAEFKKLAKQGFVAARVHMPKRLPYHLSADEMQHVAHCAADVGWHIEIHCHGTELAEIIEHLPKLPCPVVIDHMAYPSPELHSCVFAALDIADVYMKISAPDRVDDQNYEIGAAAARMLIERVPEKLLWGSDWPHVGIENVDDDALMALLATYKQDALQQILTDNPDKLYFS